MVAVPGQMKARGRKSGRNAAPRYERADNLRLEINIAFKEIEHGFSKCKHRPLRIARKWDGDLEYLELAFISPIIGNRYRPLIHELEFWTLWDIRIRQTPNIHAIAEAVKKSVPNGFRLITRPGIHGESKSVHVQGSGTITETIHTKWIETIREITGYNLVVTPEPNPKGTVS